MDRITRLIDVIKKLIETEFTGYIKINFTQGTVGRIEKFEEFDEAVILRSRQKPINAEEKKVS